MNHYTYEDYIYPECDGVCRELPLLPMSVIMTGAISAIIADRIASRYGHSFTPFETNNSALINIGAIGIIGAIQNLAPLALISAESSSDPFSFNELICAHVITTGGLLGLTALAKKTQMSAQRLSLALGALLCVSSCMENKMLIESLR